MSEKGPLFQIFLQLMTDLPIYNIGICLIVMRCLYRQREGLFYNDPYHSAGVVEIRVSGSDKLRYGCFVYSVFIRIRGFYLGIEHTVQMPTENPLYNVGVFGNKRVYSFRSLVIRCKSDVFFRAEIKLLVRTGAIPKRWNFAARISGGYRLVHKNENYLFFLSCAPYISFQLFDLAGQEARETVIKADGDNLFTDIS